MPIPASMIELVQWWQITLKFSAWSRLQGVNVANIYGGIKGTTYPKYNQSDITKASYIPSTVHILVEHSKPPSLVSIKSENIQQNIRSSLVLLSYVYGFSLTRFLTHTPG